MRKKITNFIEIPEGVECVFADGIVECKKADVSLERKVSVPGTRVEIKDGKISLVCEKGNKVHAAKIKSAASQINNMIKGLDEKFEYELEVCHVHFPMTVKVEGNFLEITNFLGEKHKRKARILEGVEVEIKGTKITVKSNDIEKAGQTAANIEKSVRVPKKDRRIFQDGIFMVSKAGRAI